jgi:hypothetical protein
MLGVMGMLPGTVIMCSKAGPHAETLVVDLPAVVRGFMGTRTVKSTQASRAGGNNCLAGGAVPSGWLNG